VVLVLPEDMLTQTVDAMALPLPRVEPVAGLEPPPDALQALREPAVEVAQRPFVIAGGGGLDAAGGRRRCSALHENWQLPVGPMPSDFQDTVSTTTTRTVRRRCGHRDQSEAGPTRASKRAI
jgi:acetolactate synthase-1/2/3 large subunit